MKSTRFTVLAAAITALGATNPAFANSGDFTYQGSLTACDSVWNDKTSLRVKMASSSGSQKSCFYYSGYTESCGNWNPTCKNTMLVRAAKWKGPASKSYNELEARYKTKLGAGSVNGTLYTYSAKDFGGTKKFTTWIYGDPGSGITKTLKPGYSIHSWNVVVSTNQE